MRQWARVALAVVVLAAFAGIFVYAGGLSGVARPGATPTPVVVKRGNYLNYLYGITNVSQGARLAQFDPSLPTDDTVVISALKSLALTSYGSAIPDDVQPAVETIDEVNYVTFTYGGHKILFELFRNSHGQVGSVRFRLE